MRQFIKKYNQVLKQTNFKKETSAGILIYRYNQNQQIEVLLGKNGGPVYQNRYKGAWNIPKGHVEGSESLKEGAVREFHQETNINLQPKDIMNLFYIGMNSTKSGKNVHIFALQKDCNPGQVNVPIKSNLCDFEWPYKSGNIIQIPELSQAKYFNIQTAKEIIFPYQKYFLESLIQELK